MQQLNKKLILSLAALLVVCGASLTGTALAHDGVSGSGNSGSGSNDDSVATTAASETDNDQETEHSKTLREQFKEDAKTKVQADRKLQAKAKTHEQLQKSCDARKANLTKRMNNSVAAAQRHKDVFDKFYTKDKNFYVTKKLNVANYDELTANVDKAQQDAVDQIAALKALDLAVDCTQTDSLATNISAFQTAVGSTRDSLKAYRKSLVALITQLHGASTSTDKTDDSSNNTTTE
jgi:small-conductance mechanosensitive channel